MRRELTLYWADRSADAHGVDQRLVRAVIWVESRGTPQKVMDTNGRYSRGVMQIQEPAAFDVGFRGDPERLMGVDGVWFGVAYLARQIARADGDVWQGVGLYNAGSFHRISPRHVERVREAYRQGLI